MYPPQKHVVHFKQHLPFCRPPNFAQCVQSRNMSYYKYKSKDQKLPPLHIHYSLERLNILAAPKERPIAFIPDKPSPYWVDYVLDTRPHRITDPYELMDYYQQFYKRMPRLEVLARPKTFAVASTSPKSAQVASSCGMEYFSKYSFSLN